MSNLRKALIVGFDFAAFTALLTLLLCVAVGVPNMLIGAGVSIMMGGLYGFCIFTFVWQILDDICEKFEIDENDLN